MKQATTTRLGRLEHTLPCPRPKFVPADELYDAPAPEPPEHAEPVVRVPDRATAERIFWLGDLGPVLTEADWERILALNGGEPEALEASRPLLCADESTRDAIEGPPWLRDALEDPPWLRDAMHEQPRSRG